MNFQYMREFIVLSDVLNFQNAADSLYLSQGTLSRHIQKMEQELGLQLFDRSNKSVKLTEFGKLFLPYARDTLALEQEYTQVLDDVSRKQDSLRVCTIKQTVEYGISKLILDFCSEHPKTDFQMMEEDMLTGDLIHANNYNYVFLWEDSPKRSDGLHRIPLASDDVILLMSKDHPYASKKSVSVSELSSLNDIIPGSRYIWDHYSRVGLNNFSHQINSRSIATIMNFVRSSQFLALFMKRSVESFLSDDMAYAEVEDSTAYLNLICNDRKNATDINSQFLHLVDSHYRGLTA